MKLKCSLHTHTREEIEEWIFHDARGLIDEAVKRNYDVVSFTCHNYFFWDDEVHEYAKKKGIILIPGIERSIFKKHVLILNATKEAEYINNFDDLAAYKKEHPYCAIVAPHPFYIGDMCLKESLIENIELFDGVELCHYDLKGFDWNKKAKETAQKYNLPLIATGDAHTKEQLDKSFCFLETKSKSIADIITSLKANKVTNHHKKLNYIEFIWLNIKLSIVHFTSIVKRIRNKVTVDSLNYPKKKLQKRLDSQNKAK